MSTALRLFGIEGEGQKCDSINPDQIAVSRSEYGIPEDMTGKEFMEILQVIDGKFKDHTPENALVGVNLGLLIIGQMNGTRPIKWTPTGNGFQVPKAFYFAPNTPVFDGVQYSLSNFGGNAPGFTYHGDLEDLYLSYDDSDLKRHSQLHGTTSNDKMEDLGQPFRFGTDGEHQSFYLIGNELIRKQVQLTPIVEQA